MKSHKRIVKILSTSLSVVIAILLIATSFIVSKPDKVTASILANFNPGNIMSDSVMTNYRSMSEAQIQQFLISRCNQPNCVSRRTFNGESASRIIHQAAQEWRINPQVLIVKLQKEQGLITNPDPQQWRLDSATGFGCPDSTPGVCMDRYLGFRNQIRNAARFFRAHMDQNPHWWKPHRPGWNNIFWHPSGNPIGSTCGTSRVYIQNRATSALYSYTPFRPNQAALNAGGWQRGDSCSSYGNRNFFYDFTRWFGSTQISPNWFRPLDVPRYMEVRSDSVRKIDIFSNEVLDRPQLSARQQIFFVDKIHINGRWLLRTRHDHERNINHGILQTDVQNIPFENIQPVIMTMNTNGNKSRPDNRAFASPVPKFQSIEFTSKVTIAGITHYRTRWDTERNLNLGIHERFLSPFEPRELDTPRYFHNAARSVNIVNPFNGQVLGTVGRNNNVFIQDRTIVNGRWYFRILDHSNNNAVKFIRSDDLRSGYIRPYASAVNLTVKNNICKTELRTMSANSTCLNEGRVISIAGTISLGDETFFVTNYDLRNNRFEGIRTDAFFTDMLVPRYFTLARNRPKVNLKNLSQMSNVLTQGSEIKFTTRITINGNMYLRTRYDTDRNIIQVIPISDLLR